MNCTRYNPNCNGKVRWDGDGDGADVGEDGDDDLDDARDGDDDNDDDLPLRERFSLAESGCRRGLLLSAGFRLAAAVKIRSDLPSDVSRSGGLYM